MEVVKEVKGSARRDRETIKKLTRRNNELASKVSNCLSRIKKLEKENEDYRERILIMFNGYGIGYDKYRRVKKKYKNLKRSLGYKNKNYAEEYKEIS